MLATKTLARQDAVMSFLASAAADQQFAQVALTYAALVRRGATAPHGDRTPPAAPAPTSASDAVPAHSDGAPSHSEGTRASAGAGATARELQAEIEGVLLGQTQVAVQFGAAEALSELHRLSLVRDTSSAAPTPPSAPAPAGASADTSAGPPGGGTARAPRFANGQDRGQGQGRQGAGELCGEQVSQLAAGLHPTQRRQSRIAGEERVVLVAPGEARECVGSHWQALLDQSADAILRAVL